MAVSLGCGIIALPPMIVPTIQVRPAARIGGSGAILCLMPCPSRHSGAAACRVVLLFTMPW
jgi:hypothetical protein